VIIGAGAIGVTFAAELHRAGHAVALIARGAQLQAARDAGITYVRPEGERKLSFEVHGAPDELSLREDDILVLATKTQDAADALAIWAPQPVTRADGTRTTAGEALPLLTTQNGLDAERSALRHFGTVFGGVLALPATYVKPGVVVAHGAPTVGAAWLGLHPRGEHPRLEPIARDLRRANLAAAVVDDITAFKQAKLVVSVTFALDALFQPSPQREQLAALVRQEAAEILAADGSEIADLSANGNIRSFAVEATPGHEYGGTSTWQSLARASAPETSFINGEIVLRARLLGRDAPANRAIVERIQRVARDGAGARALSDDELAQLLAELTPNPVLIDAEALNRGLAGRNPPRLLDVRWKLGDPRGREHHERGHIPGAVYVDLDTELAAPPSAEQGRHPLPEIEDLQAAARAWGLSDGDPVVVYDDLGGLSAARAWWLLRWAGVENVRILNGSLNAWISAGLPLETGTTTPLPGDVTLSAGQLPTLTAEQAATLARDGLLLDARAAERYRGETEPIDPQAGHIPGALSWPAGDSLGADGLFLDADALRLRLSELVGEDGAEIGVYCGSGVTAAHLAAALELAGVRAALFPGSWSAWSADRERPVAVGAAPN
jgi:thiosulfate/3-mercaptopyruvate sulfurtransferase